MIENAWSWCMSIVHEKEGEEEKTRKKCVDWNLEQGKVRTNEDQRSKRARLLTRFQKGDPEGRRDHFHFDQKFSSKTQKTKMKMLVAKSDRIKKLGVLNRESSATNPCSYATGTIGFCAHMHTFKFYGL